MLKFCPNCGEHLERYAKASRTQERQAVVIEQSAYDQTAIWKKLVALANGCAGEPPSPETLVLPVLSESTAIFLKGQPVRSVIHLVFDGPVTPQGGMLQRLAVTGDTDPPSADYLEANGYVVHEDRVVTVDDVPVGKGYQVIDYWGGQRQHKRWHLEKPVSLNPSRHGDPYFMDDNLVAFGAKWTDSEHLEAALLTLMELFIDGINASGRVAVPLALAIYWQTVQS